MEITERTEIKENTPEGWSRHPVWQYQKKDQGKAIVRRGYDTWTFADFDKGILVSTVSADIGIAGIQSISYMDYERAAALSVLMFLLCLVGAIIYIRANMKEEVWSQ